MSVFNFLSAMLPDNESDRLFDKSPLTEVMV